MYMPRGGATRFRRGNANALTVIIFSYLCRCCIAGVDPDFGDFQHIIDAIITGNVG